MNHPMYIGTEQSSGKPLTPPPTHPACVGTLCGYSLLNANKFNTGSQSLCLNDVRLLDYKRGSILNFEARQFLSQ